MHGLKMWVIQRSHGIYDQLMREPTLITICLFKKISNKTIFGMFTV